MKLTRMFHGKVERGQIQLADPRGWQRLIDSLEGKDIEVGMAKRRKVRSLSQNAYFHGVILPLLSEASGYDPDAMKDALKYEFLRVEPTEKGKLVTVRGTSDLDTVEFAAFVERCIRLGAEMYGIVIPDPFFLGEQ